MNKFKTLKRGSFVDDYGLSGDNQEVVHHVSARTVDGQVVYIGDFTPITFDALSFNDYDNSYSRTKFFDLGYVLEEK